MSPHSNVTTMLGARLPTSGDDVADRLRDATRTLSLLRRFRLTCSNGEVPLSPAAQRLLALLALERRLLRRSAVAGTLWAEMTQHRALANLRRVLWRLPEPAGLPLVTEENGGLALAPDICVDVRRRRVVVSRLEQGELCGDDDLEDLRSELLPEWPDEWIVYERERCRQDGLHGLGAAAVVAADQNKFALAVRIALVAIELDPFRESSYRGLIRVHLLEGNLVDARRSYEHYLTMLREARLEPVVSDQMRALVAHLLPA